MTESPPQSGSAVPADADELHGVTEQLPQARGSVVPVDSDELHGVVEQSSQPSGVVVEPSQSQVTPEKGDKLLDSIEVAATEDYADLVQAIVLGLH